MGHKGYGENACGDSLERVCHHLGTTRTTEKNGRTKTKETSAARSTKGGARDDLGAELSDYWKGRRAAVEAGRGTRGTH